MTPQEWHPSRLKSSPPPLEPRRTSYTPGPTDESFPEEEEGDWEPPMRSVVGTLRGGLPEGGNARTGELGRQKNIPGLRSSPGVERASVGRWQQTCPVELDLFLLSLGIAVLEMATRTENLNPNSSSDQVEGGTPLGSQPPGLCVVHVYDWAPTAASSHRVGPHKKHPCLLGLDSPLCLLCIVLLKSKAGPLRNEDFVNHCVANCEGL